MRGSSWRRLPAAALRGFTNSFSPRSRWRAFMRSKSARSMSTSPRTSRRAGALRRAACSGSVRTVRRFAVTSSPVVPSPRVAPCTKDAVLVDEADGEAVELGLAVVRDALDAERVAHAAVERLDVLVGERVVEREHRHAMRDGAERARRRAAHALRRRIRGAAAPGTRASSACSSRKSASNSRVGHRRRVEDVVAVVVALDVLAQPPRPLDGVRWRRHAAQENRRWAAGLPAGMPRASMAP